LNQMFNSLRNIVYTRAYETGFWMNSTALINEMSKIHFNIGGKYPIVQTPYLDNSFIGNILRVHKLLQSDNDWNPHYKFLAQVANGFYDSNFDGGNQLRVTITNTMIEEPSYDASYPSAFRWGNLGFILGHELTHGLSYSQYDHLTNEGKGTYLDKLQCFNESYSELEIFWNNGTKLGNVNITMTWFENIGDSGISLAYDGFKSNQDNRSYGNLTPEKLFFIASAQWMCRHYSDYELFYQYKTDTHATNVQRVNGMNRNFKEFANAFNCPIDSFMNPRKKCAWWH